MSSLLFEIWVWCSENTSRELVLPTMQKKSVDSFVEANHYTLLKENNIQI